MKKFQKYNLHYESKNIVQKYRYDDQLTGFTEVMSHRIISTAAMNLTGSRSAATAASEQSGCCRAESPPLEDKRIAGHNQNTQQSLKHQSCWNDCAVAKMFLLLVKVGFVCTWPHLDSLLNLSSHPQQTDTAARDHYKNSDHFKVMHCNLCWPVNTGGSVFNCLCV